MEKIERIKEILKLDEIANDIKSWSNHLELELEKQLEEMCDNLEAVYTKTGELPCRYCMAQYAWIEIEFDHEKILAEGFKKDYVSVQTYPDEDGYMKCVTGSCPHKEALEFDDFYPNYQAAKIELTNTLVLRLNWDIGAFISVIQDMIYDLYKKYHGIQDSTPVGNDEIYEWIKEVKGYQDLY
ncbi:MAG: hypothetical protein KatS3mg031_2771 [Chitinophagales bacterium]|nr:MAG: hypothetical protein KatS3mg031_2771 [Chitinophagales bacterium]